MTNPFYAQNFTQYIKVRNNESDIQTSDWSRPRKIANSADNLHLQALQFQIVGRWLLKIPWRDRPKPL